MQQHIDSLCGRKDPGGQQWASVKGDLPLGDKEIKLARLSEADDVEAYLTTFEQMMAAFEVPKARCQRMMPVTMSS